MSQTLADDVPQEEVVEGGGDGGVAQTGAVSFADLVRAHYEWSREAWEGSIDGDRPPRPELAEAYREALREFEGREGAVQQAYWCVRMPSGVALTQKQMRRLHRPDSESLRIHRVCNWLMPRKAHKLAELLHRCDALSIRVGEILRGTPERIAMRSIYAVESHILAFIERTELEPAARETDEFIAAQERTLRTIEACYRDAADKVCRMVYVTGMLFGVAALPLLALVTAGSLALFHSLNLHDPATRTFFACFAAGGIGAVVSVLTRMTRSDKFSLDPEVGRRTIHGLGLFRPFIGAAFGLALYFLLKSSLLQLSPAGNTFYFFVTIAFLGGFNERWAKVMLHQAETAISRGGGGADPAATRDQPA